MKKGGNRDYVTTLKELVSFFIYLCQTSDAIIVLFSGSSTLILELHEFFGTSAYTRMVVGCFLVVELSEVAVETFAALFALSLVYS